MATGQQESSHHGGCGASGNRIAGATSGSRKKPAVMQSSRIGGVGRVGAAGGYSKAFFRQMNKLIIDAAGREDIPTLLWVINRNLADMNLVNLSTSIHRLAKFAAMEVQTQRLLGSNEVVKALLATIESKLIQARVNSTLPQILSNIAWSFATMQIQGTNVLVVVAELAFKAIDDFKPYELSTLVWAFAKLHGSRSLPPSVKRVFFAAATQASKDPQSFSFRNLANIAWAYATVGVRHFQLFKNIAWEMIHVVDSANCQGIANAIWAFSTAGHSDVKLFDVLTEAALPIINDFKAQELSSMLWSLAISGIVKESVLAVALDAVRVMDLSPQQLANIVWACAMTLPTHSMTQAAVVDLLPRIAEKFMAFKLLEVSSVMHALAKVASVDGEDATVLNGASLLPPSVYQSIYAFLRFATPWFEKHLCKLHSQIFTLVVCVHEVFGLAQDGNLSQMLEQQVIDRVDSLPCEQILQLLRALLSSRPASQAVCLLAGNLARNFGGLHAKQRQQLQQLAVAAFQQAGLQSPPDEEMLYSWCLALAVKTPELAQDSICEAWGEADGSAELMELQDSLVAKVDANDGNSILSGEPGEFSHDCRLGSVDSLPNFPNTPEDSDDEYYMALSVQQANKVRSMNLSGGISHCMSADGVGMMPVAVQQPYEFWM